MSYHAPRLSALSTSFLAGAAVAALATGLLAAPAQAAAADHDGDGIPTRFERSHNMRPRFAGDARLDFDRDGLINRVEYRLRIKLRVEDSDNDGMDDGDEVKDGAAATDVDDADTDDDGRVDGHEDLDRDRILNEDEDDALELCLFDDDDDDLDGLADEDENERRLRLGDDDSDDDGVEDGDEDSDADGEANEDEDDDFDDRCNGDYDGDGWPDEDELFGAIVSFEAGLLTVDTVAGARLSFSLDPDVEVEREFLREETDADEDEGTVADLKAGVKVAEVDIDDETGLVTEIAIYVG